MISLYRFILALCVVQGHLLANGAPWIAWQAVFSFYALSGFLMTLILTGDYGFTAAGLGRFAVNRFLRLFPTYLVVVGLTAGYIAAIGPLFQLNRDLRLPQTAGAWLANISILGLTGFDPAWAGAMARLVPTAWSLSIELVCYALLAVFAASSPRRLFFMAAVGAAIAGTQIWTSHDLPDFGFQGHYTVLQAGLLPFAIGGLACWYRDRALFEPQPSRIVVALGALALNAAAGLFYAFHAYVSGLLVAALLTGWLTPMLFRLGAERAGWQKAVGGMAYPLFLCHWFVGTLVAIYLPGLHRIAPLFLLVTVVFGVALSYGLYVFVDRPVQRVRTSIKRQNRMALPDIEAIAAPP